METKMKILIDSEIPSTCAVMDWLKEHNFPDCDHTFIKCNNNVHGGIISNFLPDDWMEEMTKEEVMAGTYYNGMYRCMTFPGMWLIYVPEIDKYYYITL